MNFFSARQQPVGDVVPVVVDSGTGECTGVRQFETGSGRGGYVSVGQQEAILPVSADGTAGGGGRGTHRTRPALVNRRWIGAKLEVAREGVGQQGRRSGNIVGHGGSTEGRATNRWWTLGEWRTGKMGEDGAGHSSASLAGEGGVCAGVQYISVCT